MEANTSQVVKTLPLPVTLRSVFSKFRVLPVHGVNFGPLEIGTTKNKKIQICNDGEFEFLYRIFPAKDRDQYTDVLGEELLNSTAAAAGDKKGKKDDKKGKKDDKKGEQGAAVEMGPFKVGPSTGSIPPGSTVDITIDSCGHGGRGRPRQPHRAHAVRADAACICVHPPAPGRAACDRRAPCADRGRAARTSWRP